MTCRAHTDEYNTDVGIRYRYANKLTYRGRHDLRRQTRVPLATTM